MTGGEPGQVEDILSAFERQLEAAVENAGSEGSNSIIDHPDCYTRMACHLVQNPFWSPEWRRLLNIILQRLGFTLGVVDSNKLSSPELFSTDFAPKVTDQPFGR